MLIFIKYFILFRLLRVSLVNSSGYRSLIVIVFRARQLIQNQSPPIGFLTNRIGEVVSNKFRQINPFFRLKSIFPPSGRFFSISPSKQKHSIYSYLASSKFKHPQLHRRCSNSQLRQYDDLISADASFYKLRGA